LTLERVVLASTKDFSHRMYLQGGIFGEVTLICRTGGFHCLDWTYPDYRREDTLRWFNDLRLAWRRNIRAARDRSLSFSGREA
jgi:hypothetical protein